MNERSEAVVYRMFDADDGLLWVGMSVNAVQRMISHRGSQHWWLRVARINVEHFAGRKAAAAAEAKAIATENPEFNLAPGHPVSWDTLDQRDNDRETRMARFEQERRERDFWRPEGTIRCGNCLRRPEWFPKRQTLEDTRCGRCGCKAFERTLAIVQVPGNADDKPLAVAS